MNHVLCEIKKRIKADRKSREVQVQRNSTQKTAGKQRSESELKQELIIETIGLDDSGVFKVTLKDDQLFKNLSDSAQKKNGGVESKDVGSQGSIEPRAPVNPNSLNNSSANDGQFYATTRYGQPLPHQQPRYSMAKSNRRELAGAVPGSSEGKYSLDQGVRNELAASLQLARERVSTADRLQPLQPNLKINLLNINFASKKKRTKK